MAKTPKTKPKLPGIDSRGRLALPLQGVDYWLRPSWEAIQAIEDQLGRNTLELAGAATGGTLSTAAMGVIAAEMMKAEAREDPEKGASYRAASPKRLAEMIYEEGTPAIMARIAIILLGAVTGGYTASGEPKPAT